MKKATAIALTLSVALTVSVLAGCGGETTQTSEADMMTDTTAMEQSTSTESAMTTMPQDTETTQSGMGGSGLLPCKLIPEPHFASRKTLL